MSPRHMSLMVYSVRTWADNGIRVFIPNDHSRSRAYARPISTLPETRGLRSGVSNTKIRRKIATAILVYKYTIFSNAVLTSPTLKQDSTTCASITVE